jgi:hypothetical protein
MRKTARIDHLWLLLTCGIPSFAAACQQDPYPTSEPAQRTISEELFRIMCKRVAFDAHRGESSGVRFDDVCDGLLDTTGALAGSPRLTALTQRRAEVVAALAQTMGDRPVTGGNAFVEGELKAFLTSLVPFYEPPDDVLPRASRAIADMMNQLVQPLDPQGLATTATPAALRAQGVLEKLASVGQRKGYRAANRSLGAIRPFLQYPGLDELGQRLLGLVAEGGAGHGAFLDVLRAGALELAEPAVTVAAREDTSLHVALDLLLAPDDTLAQAGEGPLWVLRRDLNGNAQTTELGARRSDVTPYPVPSRVDTLPRGPLDPALDYFRFFDASKTPLAAGMREAKKIVERAVPGQPSTLEKVGRGLRPLLGPSVARSVQFAGKSHEFVGPDLVSGPLADLVYAIGAFARYPETADLLALLAALLEQNENAAAAPVKMMLDVDRLADEPRFEGAKLVGVDGTPNSPHEWWDDVIAVGIRALKRPGLITELVSSFTVGEAAVQGQLYASWMAHRDRVSYNGDPLTMSGPAASQSDPNTLGACEAPCYTPEQIALVNEPVVREYSDVVDRSLPDVGMNRSLWQRTMSMIHSFNGLPLCNKKGAFLSIHGVPFLSPFLLPLGGPPPGFDECEIVQLDDSTQIFAQAMLGTASVGLKDEITQVLAAISSPLIGSTGDIQEREAQITGFRDSPTPQSLTRFIYAPRNKWVNDLFEPVKTRDGVLLTEFEPGALFPTEVPDRNAIVNGVAQSFITAGKPLVAAFEKHELRDDEGKLVDGYMFGHLMEIFHRHWSSRKSTPCPLSDNDPVCAALGQNVRDCNTGCTQSRDAGPDAKYYSPQTNLVSYEPLLIEAFTRYDFTGVLARAAADLQKITVNGTDGLTILGKFVERALTADTELRYRDGRAFAMTNTCVMVAGADGNPTKPECDCPAGAVEQADKTCLMPQGHTVRKGRIIEGGVPPIYMLLDALKGFDNAFARTENADRQKPWRDARSSLVDQFLTAVVDPLDPSKAVLQNRRARAMGIVVARWLEKRLRVHADAGDLVSWSGGLSDRFEKTFGHPLVAGALDLLDVVWSDVAAGEELAKVSAYLMDATQADAFAGLMVAAADTLTFLDREPALTPIVQFAALGLAPDAFDALDQGTKPSVERGAVSAGLALTHKVVNLDQAPTLSPLGRLLANLVLPNDLGESPLETMFDATADVNRRDPYQPTTQPFSAGDNREVFNQVQSFLLDTDRGIERLYKVIQNRKVTP